MLEARNLSKAFGGKPALQDVSFKLEKGEIYGLLGHNGAGKSTSLGIILGMVEPDNGEVEIGGISVRPWQGSPQSRRDLRGARLLRLHERLGKPPHPDGIFRRL